METQEGFNLLLVLSIEKTGGQAVHRTLRAAARERGYRCKARHAHFLDASRFRLKGNPETIAKKAEREALIRDALADPAVNTTFFTARRDPVSRLMSALWHDHHAVLEQRGTDAIFSVDMVNWAAQSIIEKERCYGAEVYEKVGLSNTPPFGKNVTRDGRVCYVLNFTRLADDFEAATADFFGAPVKLETVNAGGRRGSPGAYGEFKRAFLDDERCRALLSAQGIRELQGAHL